MLSTVPHQGWRREETSDFRVRDAFRRRRLRSSFFPPSISLVEVVCLDGVLKIFTAKLGAPGVIREAEVV